MNITINKRVYFRTDRDEPEHGTEVLLAGYVFTKRGKVWYKRRPVPESIAVPIDWMGSQVLLEVLEALIA